MASNIVKVGTRKITGTLLTQGVILLVSVVTGFIMPGMMGSKMYGFWQIYVLYMSYVNIISLGFNDGIVLFYGGKQYDGLPFNNIRSATRIFFLQIVLFTTIFYLAFNLIPNVDNRFIYHMLALNIPLTCIQCVVISTVLATNRTRTYNALNFLIRISTAGAYVIVLLLGIVDYRYMIIGDIFARILITIYCMIVGRKIFFGSTNGVRVGLHELHEKSSAGINITIAAIATSFMPVIGRIIIQFNKNVSEFGEYSFAISLLNLITIFTAATGVILFPMLKTLKEEKLPEYYSTLSFVCDAIIFLALLLYVPVYYIIQNYLFEYTAVLEYLPILFCICLPLGKIQVIILAYYKSLRYERPYFVINVVFLGLMILASSCIFYFFKSVFSIAVVTLIIIMIWYICAEVVLMKLMKLPLDFKIYLKEAIMVILFSILAINLQMAYFCLGYCLVLAVGIALQRHGIKKVILLLRSNNNGE